MKQLYYTSCVAGRSVSGQGGFQIRAATSSLGPDRQRGLLSYLGYALPKGYDDTQTIAVPERLALLDTDNGRVLCHGVYAGRDPTTNRTGNFFSHAIVDLPADFDAASAARLLDDPFWARVDREGPSTLPEVEKLPARAALTAEQRHGLWREHGKLARFVLHTLLIAGPEQRIFLAAPPDAVAAAIVLVAPLLPQPLRRSLTFSTYEREPLSSPARVVGACWKPSEASELPQLCYDGAGFAFNSLAPRQSALPSPTPFDQFVLSKVDAQSPAARASAEAELQVFYAKCGQERLATRELCELAHRYLFDGSQVDSKGLAAILGDDDFATQVLRGQGMIDRVLQWMLDDDRFRAEHADAILALTPLPEIVRRIASRAVQDTQAGQLSAATVALDELAARLPQHDQERVARQYIDGLAPTSLSGEAKLFALPRALRHAKLDSSRRREWLSVGATSLPRLLALDIDDKDKDLACEQALCESLARPSADDARVVADDQGRILRLIDRFGADDAWRPTCAKLIEIRMELLSQAARKPGVIGMIHDAAARMIGGRWAPAPLIALLNELQRRDKARKLAVGIFDDAVRRLFSSEPSVFSPQDFLASAERASWLAPPSNTHLTAALAESLLNSHDFDIDRRVTRDFVKAAGAAAAGPNGYPPALREKLEHWMNWLDFCERPRLAEANLARLARSLQGFEQNHPGLAHDCRDQATRAACSQLCDEVNPKQALLRVLRLLPVGSDLAPSSSTQSWFRPWRRRDLAATLVGWVKVYGEVADVLPRERRLVTCHDLVLAVAEIGFDESAAGELASQARVDRSARETLALRATDFVRAVLADASDDQASKLAAAADRHWSGRPRLMAAWDRARLPRKKHWTEGLFLDVIWGLVIFIVLAAMLIVGLLCLGWRPPWRWGLAPTSPAANRADVASAVSYARRP